MLLKTQLSLDYGDDETLAEFERPLRTVSRL